MGRLRPLKRLGHIIGGIVTAIAAARGKGILAILLFVGFMTYELIEYMQIGDTLWKDIQDYVVGLYAGAVIVLAVQLFRKGKTKAS